MWCESDVYIYLHGQLDNRTTLKNQCLLCLGFWTLHMYFVLLQQTPWDATSLEVRGKFADTWYMAISCVDFMTCLLHFWWSFTYTLLITTQSHPCNPSWNSKACKYSAILWPSRKIRLFNWLVTHSHILFIGKHRSLCQLLISNWHLVTKNYYYSYHFSTSQMHYALTATGWMEPARETEPAPNQLFS